MDKIRKRKRMSFGYEFTWDTCELKRIRLSASTSAGLVSGAVRPAGLQVFNSDALAGDFDLDFGVVGEPLKPIRLAGCRNGVFSGKVVLGSTKPIHGISAVAGKLAGLGGAIIPPSAVTIRYAGPWGTEAGADGSYHRREHPYPAATALLDCLLESPPKEVAVKSVRLSSRSPHVKPVGGRCCRCG